MTALKGAYSDLQPYRPPPPLFPKYMEILVPEVESYLEGCVSEKPSRKLKNGVSTNL